MSSSADVPDRKKGRADTFVWRFNDYPIPEDTLYTGGCHCGDVRFRFKGPPLTRLPGYHVPVKNCNCSICGKNGCLLLYPAREDIEWLKGEDALVDYKFATEKKAHRFCGRCGSSTCMDMTGSWNDWAGDVVGMNLRMLDGFDNNDYECMHLQKKDGKSFVGK